MVADRIKLLREAQGLTQAELAKKNGYYPFQRKRMGNGNIRPIHTVFGGIVHTLLRFR